MSEVTIRRGQTSTGSVRTSDSILSTVTVSNGSLRTIDSNLSQVAFSSGAVQTKDQHLKSWELDNGEYGTVILMGHHKVHEGKHYVCSYFASGVSVGAPASIMFRTGAAGSVHAIWGVNANRGGLINCYEGCHVTASGTSITVFNRNRKSANTTASKVFANPTATTNGTDIYTAWIGTASGKKEPAAGGGSRGSEEYILNASTQYLFKFTPESAANTKLSFECDFYTIP